jgi:hypothetical protein
VREYGRIIVGEEWQEKVCNREEWKKLLRTARDRRILHMSMESINLNTFFFWEGVLGFHQTLKGVHGIKLIKNPWSRDSRALFFNLGARWGWVDNATPRPFK